MNNFDLQINAHGEFPYEGVNSVCIDGESVELASIVLERTGRG